MISPKKINFLARVGACRAALFMACFSWPAMPWSFVFLADSRSPDWSQQVNTQVLSELASRIRDENPAFVLFGGDMVNFGSVTGYQEWTNVLSTIYAAGIPVYPIVGNHELLDLAGFVSVFGPHIPDNGPPGELDRTYAVVHENALILMLDQYIATNLHRVNHAWIDSVLATNAERHVFAVGHEPAFKIYHPDCLDDYPAERNRFWNMLRLAGGRLYFCGHDHFYDRMRLDDGNGDPKDDLWQIVVGTAGGPSYPEGLRNGDNGPWKPTPVFHSPYWGYLKVEVEGDLVRTFYRQRVDTNTFAMDADSFSYQRDRRPALSAETTPAGMQLRWYGDAVLESVAEPGSDFIDVPGARSPYTVTNSDGQQRFYRLRR